MKVIKDDRTDNKGSLPGNLKSYMAYVSLICLYQTISIFFFYFPLGFKAVQKFVLASGLLETSGLSVEDRVRKTKVKLFNMRKQHRLKVKRAKEKLSK